MDHSNCLIKVFCLGQGKRLFSQGIHLPEDVLDKIYFKNFEQFAGVKPHPLNSEAIMEECRRLETIIQAMAMIQPGTAGDLSSVEQALDYFQS